MTKLAHLCDRFIEMGWLAVVAATPLYFNVFSSRVFEPDKIVVVRCLALTMALAYVIASLERACGKEDALPLNYLLKRLWAFLRNDPILVTSAILFLTTALATITSISPAVSLWGSYQRLEGLYTLSSFVVIFLLARRGLRTQPQLDRLISTIIVVSIPVCVYGLIQHFQLDPLPWTGDTTFRVTSTMGNAIFLGAYLVMVAPLTATRLFTTVRRIRTSAHSEGKGEWDSTFFLKWLVVVTFVTVGYLLFLASAASMSALWWGMLPLIVLFVSAMVWLPTNGPGRTQQTIEVTALSIALFLQVLTVFLTQSRGPLLGLGAALVVFVIIVTVILRATRALVSLGAIGIALLAVLIVFNIPNSPFAPLKDVPYIGRLGTLFETTSGTGRVRILIWQGATELLTTIPEIGQDTTQNRMLAPLVGYGPETMQLSFHRVYQPELAHLEARNASPDRSHNDLLDYLVGTGVLGLLSYIALFAALTVTAWKSIRSAPSLQNRLLAAGILAALVGHFVESQFGIVIASTRTLFWLFAAAIAVLPFIGRQIPANDAATTASPLTEPSEGQTFRFSEAMAGATDNRIQKNPSADEKNRKHPRNPQAGHNPHVHDARGPQRDENKGRSFPYYGLLVQLAYFIVTVFFIVFLPSLQSFLPIGDDVHWTLLGVALWSAIGLVIAAGALGSFESGLTWRKGQWWIYVTLTAAAILAVMANLNVAAADVYFKRALSGENRAVSLVAAGKNSDGARARIEAIGNYQKAIILAPNEDYYYLFMGKSTEGLAEQAPTTTGANRLTDTSLRTALTLTPGQMNALTSQDWFGLSLTVLEKARQTSPLNPDHLANLGRLYLTMSNGQDQNELAQAAEYYRQAATFSPRSAQLLCEWGQVELLRGRTEFAIDTLLKAKQIDDQFAPTLVLLGDAYLKQGKYDLAVEAHARAMELNPASLSDSQSDKRLQTYIEAGKGNELEIAYQQALPAVTTDAVAHNLLGTVLFANGSIEEAAAEFEKSAELAPNDWTVQRNLALTYQKMGQLSEARAAAEKAMRLAPQSQVPELQDLVTSLKQ